MKIKFKENNFLNKNNFHETLEKALKNLDDYEFSEFLFEKEWQLAYIKFIEEIVDSIVQGLALNLNVDPLKINKAFHIPALTLLKTSQGDISAGSFLYKSLWQKLKEAYKKSTNVFKKFFFNKGKPLKPMKIKGQTIYNPETKKDLTKEEWKNIEDGVIDYLKDTLKDPNEEIAIRSGLFGLLKKKMDDEKISKKKQKKMSYDNLIEKFGPEINDTEKVYKKISKEKNMKATIDYAKKHGAEFLSIDDGKLKNKIVSMFRKQIVGGLEDGISAQEMISRLYWIDPSDELGKRFNEETINAYNRNLRRIVLTEMSFASNNGYLAANKDDAKKEEKLYFVYSGQYNPREKAGEPCNIWIGKIGLLVDNPQGNDSTDDKYADFLIWEGKTNVGRKHNNWWFTVPSHPWCQHFWERIYPEFQQWNEEIGSIEFKTMEKSKNFSLDNIEWKKNKLNPVKKNLPELVKKIKKELKIDFPIIIRLYKKHKNGSDIRSMHDEGIIFLYESTPDWIGDTVHEIGHLYFHLMEISKNKKIITQLNKIKNDLNNSKSFNRVFDNDHTKSNIKEIFATIFKWYISGKIIDKTYLDVLLKYLPGKIDFLNNIFNGNLKKSKSKIENANSFSKIEDTIAFDFDKVIAKYDGWKGLNHFGKPIQKTINLIKEYKKQNFKIIIFTSRPDNVAIRKYLKENNVYYDKFIGNKPYYNCFVDDKTVNNLLHNKNLKQTIDKVLSLDKDLKKSMKLDLIKNDKTKLKMTYEGIPINIEWLKGEIKSYPGSPWKNPMNKHHYGYIRNTDSPDGEDIDVYIHIPIKKNAPIYMLNQLHAGDKFSGEFDEHKFMIGYPNKKSAKEAYIESMQKDMFGGMTKLSLKNFKNNILPFYKRKKNVK